ncbi:unnamed protein product [Durusdinium trenchii]|uniref:Uncharacterized protein n=2 Tax=Durusdinium trenchii TaxID=1381693 RepID=A0ABP0MPJ4_9DINO
MHLTRCFTGCFVVDMRSQQQRIQLKNVGKTEVSRTPKQSAPPSSPARLRGMSPSPTTPAMPKAAERVKAKRNKAKNNCEPKHVRDLQKALRAEPKPIPDEESEPGLETESTSTSSQLKTLVRAVSEPPLPRGLDHLGIPHRTPGSSPKTPRMVHGRVVMNRMVAEWELAQSRRLQNWFGQDMPESARGRRHQDSSAVNAVVFGCRRTRPGSVDPGLGEDRVRPGASAGPVLAGIPAGWNVGEGRRSVTSATGHGLWSESLEPRPSRPPRKMVPRFASASDGGSVGEVVFGSLRRSHEVLDHPEVVRRVWGGCAGQPSLPRERAKKSTHFSTLWDIKGSGGLCSQSSCTCSSSEPGSPSSRASSAFLDLSRQGMDMVRQPSDCRLEASPWHASKPPERGVTAAEDPFTKALLEGPAG